MEAKFKQSLEVIAQFYDQRKVADDIGAFGFWRSSDLKTLLRCFENLQREGLLRPDSLFLDMGCGDGRVNVLMSYFVKASVGIECDQWALDEYGVLREGLDQVLRSKALPLPPPNIYLFKGDVCSKGVHEQVKLQSGIGFEEFDFFYTYLVMHEEFSSLISAKAKPGAIFMLYGVGKVLPQYDGLKLMSNISPMLGILALYRKE